VVARKDGPIELQGPFAITGSDKQAIVAGTKTKLCRCGHSEAKPFCDGTHKRVGFKSG
jgi:CDGSH-type Zn-finger protein